MVADSSFELLTNFNDYQYGTVTYCMKTSDIRTQYQALIRLLIGTEGSKAVTSVKFDASMAINVYK